jgi:DNA repair protein RecN (Recombination protein N)
MLTSIRIRDFAVIERLSVTLGPGLNALTGETGAGKSIIVGALSLLLGERASSDVVRAGASRAVVEAVFDVSHNDAVQTRLADHGIDPEDGLLILRREISAGGRGRVWVNGAASTVTLLAELGGHLVDLHGQHEHQSLLQPRHQRALLDAYADSVQLAAEVQRYHGSLRSAQQRRVELDARIRETEQRADFLRFQVEEIDRARIQPGEEEALEIEASRLTHAVELSSLAGALHAELYAGEHAIAARLADVRRSLDQLARIDPSLQQWRETVENALFSLEEMGREMGDYAAAVESDPVRLDALRRRQDLLFRLKRKYGPDLDDVIRTGAQARAELAALDSSGLDRDTIEREIGETQERLAAAATRLSSARQAAGRRLTTAIGAVLPELGMTAASFTVELMPLPEIAGHGAEDVEFRIAVNSGFEPRPLGRVASGGELSRVMLALKTELARLDAIPSLVFDEIDAGIGGRVANRVGEKLKSVARDHQVFVITHLPQLASRADVHLLVQKVDQGATTVTTVHPLTGDARVLELARLLGGDPESTVSIEHAREMLATS